MTSTPPPPAAADSAYTAWRRAAIGRAWIALVLAVMDVALMLIAGVVWRAQERGSVSGLEAAPVTLMGASALAGLPVLAVIALANIRAIRARRTGSPPEPARTLASAGRWLALLRLVALVGTAVVVLAVTGLDDALVHACVVAIAIFDAAVTAGLATGTGKALRQFG